MSHRRRSGDSSLELLLDTITNTFGGILFLAILVSLLLRTASPIDARPTDSSSGLTASEQAALVVKVDDLKDQLSRLQRRPAPPDQLRPDPRNARGRQEAELVAARLAASLEERATLALATAEHQRQRADALEEASQFAARRAAAAERLSTAKNANDAAAVESQRLGQMRLTLERNAQPITIEHTVGMPRLRDTDKQQACIYVRFGKLFMMHTWRGGVRCGPNPQYFVVAPGDPQVARPKPDAGILISADTVNREVQRLLAPFPPAHWGIAIVVFHDSFNEFQLVKQAIVEAGYEYNPFPIEPGGSVVDTGGRSRAQ